jgi:SAM-dependent methyltransferase
MPESTVPWDLIICPSCGRALESEGHVALCPACQERYPVHAASGLDLRLRRPRKVALQFELGTDLFADGKPDFSPLSMNPKAEVDFHGVDLPVHMNAEMASYLPAARHPGSVCLDLGCGGGESRGPIEHAGYRWVGVDYADERAPLLADGHALPFADGAFDLVVSLAVLEHIRYPHVMTAEVFRVVRPGGMFLGSVAYLVPFHLASYYNMTHYGTYSTLRHTGFHVEKVASDPRYLGIRAMAFAGLFLGAPRRLAYAAVWPVVVLHRLWWRARRLRRTCFDETTRLLLSSGAFVFVARKPVGSSQRV